MAQPRPSEEVMEQTRRVLKVARERGVDPVLALDDAGLLMYPALHNQLSRELLAQMAQILDEMPIDAMAKVAKVRTPATPLDMKNLAVLWLRANSEPPA